MTKSHFILVFFLVVAGFFTPLVWSSPGHDLQVVKGQIVSIDEQSSVIVVKWYDQINVSFDEITIFVPQEAQIYKGTERIDLIEINNFDNVNVEYYNDSPGPLKAVRIFVNL